MPTAAASITRRLRLDLTGTLAIPLKVMWLRPGSAYCFAQDLGTTVLKVIPIPPPVDHIQPATTGGSALGVAYVRQLLAFSLPYRYARGRTIRSEGQRTILPAVIALIDN